MGRLNPERRISKIIVALSSAAVILVCLFGHLGAIGLVGPDEPRYAWIARSMAATGDWLTPRLYGTPWFEKPILYYWAAAIGFRLHLSPEWAARLPSALGALATALALAWLAHRFYGRDTDGKPNVVVLAPLLFSTNVAAVGFARAATPDMLFSASLTLAMASAAAVLVREGAFPECRSVTSNTKKGDLAPLFFFGVAMGLAALAKGPAAIILAGGALGLWALATKQWRVALRFLHPVSVTTFSIVALPWYILCAFRNREFIRVFILEHNFERYLTPVFQHRQPFWFFGPITCLALIPWTALLIPVAREGMRAWREKSWAGSPGLFPACWAIFPLLFFSCSQSKLPGYILPGIPPLILLCAAGAANLPKMSRTMSIVVGTGIGAVWVALSIIGLRFTKTVPQSLLEQMGLPRISWIFVCGAIILAILMSVLGACRKPELLTVACIISVALIVAFANFRILPILDRLYSARPYAEAVRYDRRPDRIFTWKLKRNWEYGLAFYFERELPQWSPADTEPALVLTTHEGVREIQKLGRVEGTLDESWGAVLYVPVLPAPRTD